MKKTFLSVFLVFSIMCVSIPSRAYDNIGEMKQTVMSAFAAFNNHQYSTLDMYIDENFIEHSPLPGQKSGIKGLLEAFMVFANAFPDFHMTVDDIIIEGNKAAVLFSFTGTNTGSFMDRIPTNKPVNFQGVEIFSFRNGKIFERWRYFDSEKMMDQLGITSK